jgi:flagella basal body P-ring formation protein FlgA
MRMIALEDLRPGVPIRPEQVSLQRVDDFPGAHATPLEIRRIAGALPRRFINANTPVWEDSIDPPNQVTKGDRVSVTVHSGLAHLTLDAEATDSARLGDLISLKNPESGKLFRARVDGPDQAFIQTPGIQP